MGAGPCRTNAALLCTRSPRRLHTQSRRSSRGKVEASHHSDLKVMVPAACMTRHIPVSIGSVCMHAKMAAHFQTISGKRTVGPPRLPLTVFWEGKYTRKWSSRFLLSSFAGLLFDVRTIRDSAFSFPDLPPSEPELEVEVGR